LGLPFEVRQPDVRRRRLGEDEFLELAEIADPAQILVRTMLRHEYPGNTTEEVNTNEPDKPSRPPWFALWDVLAILVFPIVQDHCASTTRSHDSAHRITLDMSAMDDPTEQAADDRDENNHRPQAETNPVPTPFD
jgi:hypothetical protein